MNDLVSIWTQFETTEQCFDKDRILFCLWNYLIELWNQIYQKLEQLLQFPFFILHWLYFYLIEQMQ